MQKVVTANNGAAVEKCGFPPPFNKTQKYSLLKEIINYKAEHSLKDAVSGHLFCAVWVTINSSDALDVWN